MLVLVMSDGDGEEANVGGGPNRNPPPKFNITPPTPTPSQTLHNPPQITHLAWLLLLHNTSDSPRSAWKHKTLSRIVIS